MINDNALLVVLSYVIGFVTAFIAFGFQTDNSPITAIEQIPFSDTKAAVVMTTPYSLELDENALQIELDDETNVIISAKLREGVTEGQGFHAAIPNYALSPSGDYVYFCEQQSTADATCLGYIYIVGDHVVRKVKLAGEQLNSANMDTNLTWTDDNVLVSAEYESIAGTPWELRIR